MSIIILFAPIIMKKEFAQKYMEKSLQVKLDRASIDWDISFHLLVLVKRAHFQILSLEGLK